MAERGGARLVGRSRARLFEADYERSKRALDVLGCLALLPFALPLLAIVAVALWIDNPGPIFFVQERTGLGGRRFRMFKLRTMVREAPTLKQQLSEQRRLSGPDFKLASDPRVTRIGSFLRRSSLDELPQLWNVLRGDMSLVGPRPTSFPADAYALWQTERLEVPPGLTGLWQVEGRGDIDFDQRVRLDIAYIEGRSLGFDLRILLRTVWAVLRGRGAY